MPTVLWKLLASEMGSSAVEYCLLLVFIAAIIITAVGTLGNTVNSGFDTMAKGFPGQ